MPVTARLSRKLYERFGDEIAELKSDLTRWMFVYSSGTLLTISGLMLALLRK